MCILCQHATIMTPLSLQYVSVCMGVLFASLGCFVGHIFDWGLLLGICQQSTVAMKLSSMCMCTFKSLFVHAKPSMFDTADRGASRAAEVLDRVHGQGAGRQGREGGGQPTVSRLPMCPSHLQIWLLCQHGAHHEDPGEICCTPKQCQLQCNVCKPVTSRLLVQ